MNQLYDKECHYLNSSSKLSVAVFRIIMNSISSINIETARKRRKQKSNKEIDDVLWNPRKRFCVYDYTVKLPDETLIEIFSYMTHIELYKSVRCVCRRWSLLASSSQLWKNIFVKNEIIPSQVLFKWLEHSSLLEQLVVKGREDINKITEKVSKHCKRLRSLRIENPWHSEETLSGVNLCRLLTRCKYLNNLYFSGVKIRSCKFFKLLSFRKHFGANRCSYYGPISRKQMKALLDAIINSATYEAATLFTVNNKKIPIKLANEGNHCEPIAFDNIWDDITNDDDALQLNNPGNHVVDESGDNVD